MPSATRDCPGRKRNDSTLRKGKGYRHVATQEQVSVPYPIPTMEEHGPLIRGLSINICSLGAGPYAPRRRFLFLLQQLFQQVEGHLTLLAL